MAISFNNIFKEKILDFIRSFLNTEFAGTFPVYTGDFKDMGNQSIRLMPIGSNLLELTQNSEVREYIVDISYTFKEKQIKRDSWSHILRQLSHIEALFQNNITNTFYNGRLVSCRINNKTPEETRIEGLNVILWEWRGSFMGNVG